MKRVFARAAGLISALLLLFPAGCATSDRYVYDNAAQYSVGAFSLTGEEALAVRLVEIDWIAGAVEVVREEDGDTLSLSETGASDEAHTLRYELRGETLRVKFMQSGLSYDVASPKTLRVTIPLEVMFENVNISTVSADISVDWVFTNYMDLETVSGNITATDLGTSHLSVSGVSGSVLISGGVHRDIALSSVSGGLGAENVTLTGAFSAESVSGDISFAAALPQGGIEASSVSGDVRLSLPEDASFSLSYESESGDLFDDFGLLPGDEGYLAGEGEGHIHIHTTSGDLFLSLKVA